jgi:hypothetical protein
MVHAYNCTKHETTGYSPFYLMYGRHPRLPVDLIFGAGDLNDAHTKSHQSYVEDLKKSLEKAYNIALANTTTKKDQKKVYYERKIRGATLNIGDRVLVRNVAFQGTHKLADRWQEHVYIVLQQPDASIPVFQVQTEGRQCPKKVLYRNM